VQDKEKFEKLAALVGQLQAMGEVDVLQESKEDI
jgi:hypothetical protein